MNNMMTICEPKITNNCGEEGETSTKIKFKPDLDKLGMKFLEADVVGMMGKRVLHVAGCLGGGRVTLNGLLPPVESFVDYVDLYIKAKSDAVVSLLPRFTQKVNNEWEICVSFSEGQFQQVSFVNFINTIHGGTHVDYVTNQITNHVMTVVNKKNKQAANVKAEDVKSHLWVFVNAFIDNPTFDSQSKETLTTCHSNFGSKCKLSHEFLDEVAYSEIWKKLDSQLSEEQRITDIREAKEAGRNNADKCTLILTNSLDALAMLGTMDFEYYGYLLLSGKLLNVREASHEQIMKDAEIQRIKNILGLQHGKVYDNVKSLRYGHLMIMTDQVHDGSHIKGLLMNFIHSFCPSLLDIPSFLVEIIIPILKATHKNGNILSFYTMSEYNKWKKKTLDGREKDWSLKWFQQGSGTSTSKEANLYFEILEMHKKDFTCVDLRVDAIDVAFRKKIEERKTGGQELETRDDFEKWKERLIQHKEIVNRVLVNKQLILFPLEDLQRFIPSMVDGLNDVQRKILFCAFKDDLAAEKSVAEFSGYVMLNSTYHSDDQEILSRSIIGMAQDFVGSNNINLFKPVGLFGSRYEGGKNHGNPWHICAHLNPIARFLFPKDDDNLLPCLKENGKWMEPARYYAPVIPFVLVNGSERNGTGWTSFVLSYDPRDICANIRRLLVGNEAVDMDPCYKGFNGVIKKTLKESGVASYIVSGRIKKVNDTTLRIQELPVCKWTTKEYEEFLETARRGTGKFKEPFIQNYSLTYNDDTTHCFEIIMPKENLRMTTEEELMKKFELTTTISTNNMLMFDQEKVIKKYDNVIQILKDFFVFRLPLYEKRKLKLLESLELKKSELENRVRYIRGVLDKEIKPIGKNGGEISSVLKEKGFKRIDTGCYDYLLKVGGFENGDLGYGYLLAMTIEVFTENHIQNLGIELKDLNNELAALRITSAETLWTNDLNALEKKLDELEIKDAKAAVDRKNLRAKCKNWRAEMLNMLEMNEKNSSSMEMGSEKAVKSMKMVYYGMGNMGNLGIVSS